MALKSCQRDAVPGNAIESCCTDHQTVVTLERLALNDKVALCYLFYCMFHDSYRSCRDSVSVRSAHSFEIRPP